MKPSDPAPKSAQACADLPVLSVVVPTFNERDNVARLYRKLEAALAGIAWEVIFVDDNSPDGTWDVVRGLAQQDRRVRCIRRIGRRGLSGACIEGILASSAPYAAVMDADLQHDETQLPKMLSLLQSGQAELVVGSRYIEGGSADSFNKQRAGASAFATEIARRVLARLDRRSHERLLHDPRAIASRSWRRKLSTQGFKILLDIVATAHGELQDGRSSLHLRLAAAWREQARFHGGAGFPRAGAGEVHQRRGLAALPAVRDGRGHRLVVHLGTLFIGLPLFERRSPKRRGSAPSSP